MAVRPGSAGALNRTDVVWSERKGVPGVASPLYYNGCLYSFKNDGIVFCRDAKTGNLIYSGRTGAFGYYYSSPVAADNRIYIASAEGSVVVLDTGRQLKILAVNDLESSILATPAIVDGNLYVRTESHLYSFGN